MRRRIEALSKILIVTVVAGILPLAVAGTASAARVKTIRITDASAVEGNVASPNASFTISWTGAKGGAAVTVAYATANATATAGADYTATSGTATLSQNGCRCAIINVPVLDDAMTEGTKTFQVNLSNPVNGVIGDAQGVGTIYDNEGPPSLVVADASFLEAAGSISFSVLLTNPTLSPVTVDYTTADGSAVAGTDYTTKTNSLTFLPTQVLKTVNVVVADDALNEDDETFTLNLSNPSSGATMADAQGVGTILDDDLEPNVSIGDATAVAEGDSGTATASFPVTLSAASGRDVDVDYATVNGTATADSDFQAENGTLTFTPGDTTKQVNVTVDADVLAEGDETFTVVLSFELNANIVAATGLVTITDDDEGPKIAVDDPPAVVEGNGGTTSLTFTVSMDPISPSVVTVDYSTVDGTATAGSDYTASSNTLTFAPGDLTKTVTVDVTGDATYEPDETLTLALSNPLGGLSKIIDAQGTGTITNDDRGLTALTLKLAKARTTISAKGVVELAASGMKVKATLYKKRGARYVRAASRTVSVAGLTDRDVDGRADGAYLAKFTRPGRGSYLLRVAYAGSPSFLPCLRSVRFRL